MEAVNEYVPHKKSTDKNSPWFYFLIHITDKTKTKCKLCHKPIQCNGGSTSGLHTHLKSIHQINLSTKRGIEDKENYGPESKRQRTEASQPSMTKFVVNNKSEMLLCEVLARMAARDGLSFNVLASSEDIKKGLTARKFEKIPNCPNTVKSQVYQYGRKVREEMIAEFNKKKAEGERFSLTLDEWTSNRNRRYVNVNIHSEAAVYNLGLIRGDGSLTAKKCIELLRGKLAQFEIDLDKDIVDVTSDGARVMKKLGKLIDAEQQLCFAHAIHLAVLDVMYKSKKPEENDETEEEGEGNFEDNDADANDENEDDSEDEMQDESDGLVIETEDDEGNSLSCSHLEKLIKKVRKVVKLFRRSAKKHEVYLQNYVKAEFSKDLVLILDVKTRWNSLVIMLDRFLKLRHCVQKALIDMKSTITFTEEDFNLLNETMEALAPIKIAVESLCQRDSNLLIADTATDFMLTDLEKQQTEISEKLREALIMRISERRTDLSSVLQFLHDGTQDTSKLGKKLSKPAIAKVLVKLIRRLYPNEGATSEEETGGASSESCSEDPACMESNEPTLKEKLQRDIQDKLNRPKTTRRTSSLEQTILQEVSFFKDHKVRGPNLQKAYTFLKTIPPTSVEAERAFSTANNFCSKLRTRLSDDSIDNLCFLRAYFLRKESRKK